MSGMSREIWIVVAAHNEGPRLDETLRALCERQTNVVVIDDGSVDDTAAVARRHRVWLLRHLFNCGQGAALQTGIDFALRRGADCIVTFDADGQHAAGDIDLLVEPVCKGEVDVTLGSRFLGLATGMPLARRLVLKLGVLFTRLFCRIRVTDAHNGLRALSRHAAQRIHITQNRMAHASEILHQIRLFALRYREVPVTIHYSKASLQKGQSSWNAFGIVWDLVLRRMFQ